MSRHPGASKKLICDAHNCHLGRLWGDERDVFFSFLWSKMWMCLVTVSPVAKRVLMLPSSCSSTTAEAPDDER